MTTSSTYSLYTLYLAYLKPHLWETSHSVVPSLLFSPLEKEVWKQVTLHESIFDMQMSSGQLTWVGCLLDGKIPKTISGEASSAYTGSKTAAMDVTVTALENSPSSPEHLFCMCSTDLLCLLSSNMWTNSSSLREWRDTREVSIKICAGRIKDNSLSNCRPLKLNTFFQICSHTAIYCQNITSLWPQLTFTASYQDISDEKNVEKVHCINRKI